MNKTSILSTKKKEEKNNLGERLAKQAKLASKRAAETKTSATSTLRRNARIFSQRYGDSNTTRFKRIKAAATLASVRIQGPARFHQQRSAPMTGTSLNNLWRHVSTLERTARRWRFRLAQALQG